MIVEKGQLFVISGPSGAGKGTVCAKIRELLPEVVFSISMTTRSPRDNERDGEHYFFVSQTYFEKMIANGELLEFDRHFGNYYGTPKKFVYDKLGEGKDVILEIDVAGAMQVKKNYPECRLIFLSPPSIEELKNRLKKRNTETESQIAERLARVEEETSNLDRYDYVVVNDKLEKAVGEILNILKKIDYELYNRTKIHKKGEIL